MQGEEGVENYGEDNKKDRKTHSSTHLHHLGFSFIFFLALRHLLNLLYQRRTDTQTDIYALFSHHF